MSPLHCPRSHSSPQNQTAIASHAKDLEEEITWMPSVVDTFRGVAFD